MDFCAETRAAVSIETLKTVTGVKLLSSSNQITSRLQQPKHQGRNKALGGTHTGVSTNAEANIQIQGSKEKQKWTEDGIVAFRQDGDPFNLSAATLGRIVAVHKLFKDY